MERLEPTRLLALKVWWAFVWRSVLFGVLLGFGMGILLGILSVAAPGISPETASGVLTVFVGFPLGIGISIEVMYRLLRKRFKDFEIALVRAEE